MLDRTKGNGRWTRLLSGVAIATVGLAPVAAQDVVTRITDVGPGDEDGMIELDAAVLGGFLYFVTSPGSGTDLYRHDGVNPPAPVPGADAADPREVVAWNGKIYFQGGPSGDREVWEYDPADDSIGEVFDIRSGGNGLPQRFAALPSRLCFAGFDNAADFELYCWSGSGSPTRYDVETGSSSFPDHLRAWGDRLVFVASVAGESRLFEQEATTAPVEVAPDPAHPFENPCCATVAAGELNFQGSDPVSGVPRLYRYDGTGSSERLSGTLEVYTESGALRDLLHVGATDSAIGVGTPELLRLGAGGFQRVSPGVEVDFAVAFVEHEGALFFLRWTGSAFELARYCGAGTIDSLVVSAGAEEGEPIEGALISFAGRLYFSAESAEAGIELWALDSAHRHCDGFETGDATAWSATVP